MQQLSAICRGKAFLDPRWNFWSKLEDKIEMRIAHIFPLLQIQQQRLRARIADNLVGKAHGNGPEEFTSVTAALQLCACTVKSLRCLKGVCPSHALWHGHALPFALSFLSKSFLNVSTKANEKFRLKVQQEGWVSCSEPTLISELGFWGHLPRQLRRGCRVQQGSCQQLLHVGYASVRVLQEFRMQEKHIPYRSQTWQTPQ